MEGDIFEKLSEDRMKDFGYSLYEEMREDIDRLFDKHKDLFKPELFDEENKLAFYIIKQSIGLWLTNKTIQIAMNEYHTSLSVDFSNLINKYVGKVITRGIAELDNLTNGKQ